MIRSRRVLVVFTGFDIFSFVFFLRSSTRCYLVGAVDRFEFELKKGDARGVVSEPVPLRVCVCVCALASVSEEPTEEPFSRRRTSHANGSPRSRGIREYCDIFASIPENHRKAINGVKCEQQYFGEKKTNKKGATKKKRERKTGEHLWINSGKVRRFFSINW